MENLKESLNEFPIVTSGSYDCKWYANYITSVHRKFKEKGAVYKRRYQWFGRREDCAGVFLQKNGASSQIKSDLGSTTSGFGWPRCAIHAWSIQ